MQAYFDNAATTKIDPSVLEAMLPYLQEIYGNASSMHSVGRKAKAGIEQSRKAIAKCINASPQEIYFTSGGTESDNAIIRGLVKANGISHVISSPLEHHAVLHTLEELEAEGVVELHLLQADSNGEFRLEEISSLLEKYPNALVSLMHGNNEIGNLIDLKAVGELCKKHQAFFHSDTVQTMGYYPLNLEEVHIHALVGSAHKFHGPKGVGFMYLKKGVKLPSFITGGSQERGLRGGTENVANIVGMAKAMELAFKHQAANKSHILSLKQLMKEGLEKRVGAKFNGLSGKLEESTYKVLNVQFPKGWNDMLLFHLDLKGIAASGGSACSSGANTGSHVLNSLNNGEEMGPSVRFSFSKFNTKEEVDYVLDILSEMKNKEASMSY